MRSALAAGTRVTSGSNAPAIIKSYRNRKPGGNLDFRIYSPKTRRIASLVTIATAMTRLFWRVLGESLLLT